MITIKFSIVDRSISLEHKLAAYAANRYTFCSTIMIGGKYRVLLAN